jgi:hypothetical protein
MSEQREDMVHLMCVLYSQDNTGIDRVVANICPRGGHFPFFNNLRAAEYRVHLNNLR